MSEKDCLHPTQTVLCSDLYPYCLWLCETCGMVIQDLTNEQGQFTGYKYIGRADMEQFARKTA